MRQDTYTASDGRRITRVTIVGKEGDVPFHGLWVEGEEALVGDRVLGAYRVRADGLREARGEMFGLPSWPWTFLGWTEQPV